MLSIGAYNLQVSTSANDPIFYLRKKIFILEISRINAFIQTTVSSITFGSCGASSDKFARDSRARRQGCCPLQSRASRESAYPPDHQLCSSSTHFGGNLMRPFEPMRNIDSLSNAYIDNLYDFAPRPVCPSCVSRFLSAAENGADDCERLFACQQFCSTFVKESRLRERK